MDHVRYCLGVANLIAVPSGLLYWLIIHGWARWWRLWGPMRTYSALLPVLAALGVLIFQMRRKLLGDDLGTNWGFIGIAAALFGLMASVERQYWKQLSFPTLVGIPELSRQHKGRLIREGIYGVVRHPRYLSAGIGIIATSLIVNYTGLYVLLAGIAAPGYLMLLLEERELVERFGDAYRQYQRDVPKLIPRLRRKGQSAG